MCLAVPGKIIEIKENKAVIDYGTEKRTADNSLVDAKIGDYVIVQSKFVICTVDEQEALKTLEEWKNE